MILPYCVVRPLWRVVSPETAHGLALRALQAGFGGSAREADDPVLRTRVWQIDFANPLGLAAGFDKNAEVMDAMLGVGLGFVEAGSVTPRPQPGNPLPRLFRLDEDNAVINRFGFNSKGLDYFAQRLAARERAGGRVGIVGANLGKNRDTVDAAADYAEGIRRVCAHADYLVCNLSSPNTPGLRSLQARNEIEALILRVLEARAQAAQHAERLPPLLVKVGPDLDEAQVADIAEVVLATGIDGLIVGNTTVTRPPGLQSRHAAESGGLSGTPLAPLAVKCLSAMYRLTGGRLPIIGCGGISSGADAYARIRAGASLVQFYSALVFHGPALVGRIKRELAVCLRRDGFATVGDAVGADHAPREAVVK